MSKRPRIHNLTQRRETTLDNIAVIRNDIKEANDDLQFSVGNLLGLAMLDAQYHIDKQYRLTDDTLEWLLRTLRAVTATNSGQIANLANGICSAMEQTVKRD